MSVLYRIQALLALCVPFLALSSDPAASQVQKCEDGPEGRVCSVTQEIRLGVDVDVDRQRQLGLVTVAGGCSGTLLNRFWVLTARHCVAQVPPSTQPYWTGALLPIESLTVTATWAPNRVAVPTRFAEFGVNTVPGVLPTHDIILLYLGFTDLGPVDSQRIYATTVQGPGNSVRLSGRLTTSDTVTQYGQGFSTFATAAVGAMVPAGGLGTYRSGRFTPSNITADNYNLLMNGSGQVGHGGDSGGPTVVTVDGVGVGIAGVQSGCTASGYVTGAPSQTWTWATGITGCWYFSTEPFWTEITKARAQRPDMVAMLFQRHADGRIWKYDSMGQCTADACPGWIEIDRNTNTRDIVPARGTLFQRHADGRIWRYDGKGRCTAEACPGWLEIDRNTQTAAIAGGSSGLYQRHADGRIWKYDGTGQCTATACPGWTEIDHNGNTRHIVAARGTVFQQHADGRIWRYDGSGRCTASACPGWVEIDHNTNTAAIAGGSDGFYQRHADGRIWKYDDMGQCTATACPGWIEIDHNTNTVDIVAGGGALFQRHADGRIWKYDGAGRCTTDACPGWTEIDHNANTRDIAAGGNALFQRHMDGSIWKYDGFGQCTADACPGWTEIDHNANAAAIAAVELF